MNTMQLECFIAVANSLNFARAAEELHITQPAVTHQINALETELEAKLFKRTTRSVSLTQDGLSFLEDAQHILRLSRLAKARLSPQNAENFTNFSIGCHTTTELNLLPPILQELVQKHPNVHPVLRTLPLRSLENLLENNTVDVILDFENEGRARKTATYFELIQTTLMCAVSKNHPLACCKTITQDTLINEKMILQEPHRLSPSLFALQKPLVDSHSPNDLFFCESNEAAITLTKAGLGITMVWDFKSLREEDLCYLPLENPITLSYGVHYKKQHQTVILKDFLEIAAKYFAKAVE